jgi:hypothetical protein
MRSVGVLALAALFVVLTAGCDSDEPLQGGSSNAFLAFAATGGSGVEYWVHEVYEDANGDGQPDDLNDDGTGDVGLWCEATLNPGGTTFRTMGLTNAPWYFLLEISVIPVGQTAPIKLTPASALNIGPNRTGYDFGGVPAQPKPALPVTYSAGTCSQNPDIKCNATPNTQSTICEDNAAGVCNATGGQVQRVFLFRNPRTLSAAHIDVVLSTGNPVADLVPETYGREAGTFNGAPSAQNANRFSVCPGEYIGPPLIAGAPPPFELQLAKGDTLIVKFGRYPRQDPAGLTFASEPNIAALLVVNGALVEGAQLAGDTSTSPSKPTVSFTYTAR